MPDVTIAAQLLDLLNAGVEGFGKGMLDLILDQTAKRNEELANMIRAGAIPRRVDLAVIGAIRQTPHDDEGNQQLLGQVAEFSFVRSNPDRTLTYHDATRHLLLQEWQKDSESRARFQELNRRLIDYFNAELDNASQVAAHVTLAAPVLRAANLARYVQVAGACDVNLIAAVTGLLYHETLGSPLNAIESLQRHYHVYEAQNRLYVCRALLQSERDWVESRPPEDHDPILQAWLRYYEARLTGLTSGPSEAIEQLELLRSEAQADPKLEVWVLGQLGIELHKLNRFTEARRVYQQELEVARRTQADPFNIPTTLGRLASVSHATGDLQEALNGYREGIEEARRVESGQVEIQWLAEMAGIMQELGRADEALDVAAEALDRARTNAAASLDAQGVTASLFMLLLAGKLPATAETAYREGLTAQRSLADNRGELGLRIDRARSLSESSQLRRAAIALGRIREDLESQPHPDERVQHLLGIRLALGQADLAAREGRHEEALVRLRAGLAESVGLQQTEYHRAIALGEAGRNLTNLGRLDEARAELTTAMAAWNEMGCVPYAAQQQARLSAVSRRCGDLQEAARLLALAEQGIGSSSPLELRAELDRERAELATASAGLDSAADALKTATSRWPDPLPNIQTAGDLLSLSRIASAKGDAREARDHAYRALALLRDIVGFQRYEPTKAALDADKQDQAGLARYARQEDIRESLQHFKAARERMPRNVWYGINVAYAAARLGDWSEAATALGAALRRGPQWVDRAALHRRLLEFRTQLAKQDLEGGRTQAARRELKKVLARIEANGTVGCLPETGLALGDALLALGELDGSEVAYQTGLRCAASAHQAADADRLRTRLALMASFRGDVRTSAKLLRESVLSRIQRLAPAPASELLEDCALACTSMPAYLALRETLPHLIELLPDRRLELYDAWLDFSFRHLPELLRTVPERQHSESTLESASAPRVQLSLAGALAADGAETPGIRWILDEGVPNMRAEISQVSGVVVPAVILNADPALDPDGYRIVISQEVTATGTAMGKDPHREAIEHLKFEVIARLDRFVGLRDLAALLREWAGTTIYRMSVAEGVIADEGMLGKLAQVMVGLVREGVPVADLDRILGVVTSEDRAMLNADELLRLVRVALHDEIPGADRERRLIYLPKGFEIALVSGQHPDEVGKYIAIPEPVLVRLMQELGTAISEADPLSNVVVVEASEVRRAVRRMVDAIAPQMPVIAQQELSFSEASHAGQTVPNTEKR